MNKRIIELSEEEINLILEANNFYSEALKQEISYEKEYNPSLTIKSIRIVRLGLLNNKLKAVKSNE